jgi:hypothetical protein
MHRLAPAHIGLLHLMTHTQHRAAYAQSWEQRLLWLGHHNEGRGRSLEVGYKHIRIGMSLHTFFGTPCARPTLSPHRHPEHTTTHLPPSVDKAPTPIRYMTLLHGRFGLLLSSIPLVSDSIPHNHQRCLVEYSHSTHPLDRPSIHTHPPPNNHPYP